MSEPRFKTREEYEAWKAQGSPAPLAPASATAPQQTSEASPLHRDSAVTSFRVSALLFVVAAGAIFLQAKSAVHEIEALMCLLIAAVFSVGSTVAYNLQRLMLRLIIAATVLLGLAGSAQADRIYLKHGDYVETHAWREDGDHLYYRQGGGEIGILKEDVLRIERRPVDALSPAGRTQAPSTGAASRGCAETVLTSHDLRRTEDLIDIFLKMKQPDVEQHLRTCLAMQRRAFGGESVTREQMAGACCAPQ